MAYKDDRNTESSGSRSPSSGSARWMPRADAKKYSNKARRANDRRAVREARQHPAA